MRGRGRGAHEVNRRAVLAPPQMGHAGLSQFCAAMNFPPPAYNDHQIQIKSTAEDNAENLMKDAAKRLVDKVAMERPDDIEVDGTIKLTSQMCQLQLMELGITPGTNTMKALRLQDKSRIKAASKKVSEKYQKQRQKLCAQKKSKGDKTAYQAGGFSLSSQPDDPVKKKRKKTPSNVEQDVTDSSLV